MFTCRRGTYLVGGPSVGKWVVHRVVQLLFWGAGRRAKPQVHDQKAGKRGRWVPVPPEENPSGKPYNPPNTLLSSQLLAASVWVYSYPYLYLYPYTCVCIGIYKSYLCVCKLTGRCNCVRLF